uniref:Cystatin domain-containing protein n=1 Tax=Strongyloides venezuelensis TaxID=75913 RepID=A0A0K0FZJ4_STRVS
MAKKLSFSLEFKMKYLIISITFAIIAFMTIKGQKQNGQRRPITRKWKHWNGRSPFLAEVIAQNATTLFYKRNGGYYQLVNIYSKLTRTVHGTKRYRVEFNAAKCIVKKQSKGVKRNPIKVIGCVRKNTPFQAILRNNTPIGKLTLFVTNLETGKSCEKIYD